MTRYRVTKNSPITSGKRIASDIYFEKKSTAQEYADATNTHYNNANARVVKDSERVRRMIP